MIVNTIDGIVKKIENFSDDFSRVTIQPEGEMGEVTVPAYMNLDQHYVGRYTVITTQRTGFIGRKFKQTIATFDLQDMIEAPFKQIRRINERYSNLI